MKLIADCWQVLPTAFWVVAAVSIVGFLFEVSICIAAGRADRWLEKHQPTDPCNDFAAKHRHDVGVVATEVRQPGCSGLVTSAALIHRTPGRVANTRQFSPALRREILGKILRRMA